MTSSEKTARAPFRLSILHDSDTDMGRVTLRKRWSLALERDVYEMTMDGKLMMSNAVVESERALVSFATRGSIRREGKSHLRNDRVDQDSFREPVPAAAGGQLHPSGDGA